MNRKPTKPDKAVMQAVQVQQTLYQGPLPAPEALERYESTLPGAANRIICMAEDEMKHRHAQELVALQSDMALRAIIHTEENKAFLSLPVLGMVKAIRNHLPGQ